MLPPKKKEADYAALASPFMRIPRLPVDVARDLLDGRGGGLDNCDFDA